ncbi:MAG: hypothetical protein ACAI44_40615 [Candidatus Sericytochromatia bacterium]
MKPKQFSKPVKRVALAALAAILTLPALAAYEMKTWTHTSASKKATYKYEYPQVAGKPTVNAKLKAAFLPTPAHLKEMDDLIGELNAESGPTTYAEEIKGSVTLHNERVISVHYEGLGMLTPSAHPSKIIGGLTLELKTGRTLKLKDVLKAGALPLVKQEALKALKPILETTTIPEVSKAGDFDFYLTKDKLVLINLFDSYAVASVEAEIPRAKLNGSLLY